MILFVIELVVLFLMSKIKNKYFFLYYNKLVTCGSSNDNFNCNNCFDFDNMGSIFFHFIKNNPLTNKTPVVLSLELYYFVAGVIMTTFTFYMTKFIKYCLNMDLSQLQQLQQLQKNEN